MVGHTGDIEAIVVACKAADEAVKIILDVVEQVGGIYLVTADHGNTEDMVKRNKSGKLLLDKSGGPSCHWRPWSAPWSEIPDWHTDPWACQCRRHHNEPPWL